MRLNDSRLRASVLVPLIAFSLPLTAAESTLLPHQHELTVMGLYTEPDDDRGADYGTGARAIYGYRYSEHWWTEFQAFGSVIETGRQGFSDFYQQGLGIDLQYRLWGDRSDWTPFGLIGVGASRNEVSGIPMQDDEFGGFANVGLGLLTPAITDLNMRFRAEARYLHDTYENDQQDIQIGLGITVPLGVTERKTVIREKTRVVEKTVTRTTGVRDDDNDGVINAKDECPDTLKGLTVDSNGCVETTEDQSLVLRGVKFETNSVQLTPNAREILRGATDLLKGQPDIQVRIGGHTDSVGPEAYNQKLSARRAGSVKNFLLNQGIDSDRIETEGYGESRPIRSNATEDGREQNRRVEFTVLSDGQQE